MKRFLCMALPLLLTLFLGCSSAEEPSSRPEIDTKDMVTLTYYTIGNPDSDLGLVNQELNRLLAQKIGIQVNYHKVPWAEYGDSLQKRISSGGDFDIAFATTVTQGDFLGNAIKGAWLPLDSYLETNCKALYDVIEPLFWEGVRINGSIYGIPTNKELAVPIQWVYPTALVEKYGLDITEYTSLESLEPVFKIIKENEPDYTVMDLSGNPSNFFALENYEYVLDAWVPLMLRSDDESLELVNIFETDYGRKTLDTLHKYYTAGYINADAALLGDQSLAWEKKVFWFASSGGPYSDTSWSKERGYSLVGHQVTKPFVNTESVRGGIMAVNSNTKYPRESTDFLNCLNTDEEVRNLLNYGIEGKHYRLSEQNQVETIDTGYMSAQYTQGNWFILKTAVGDPLDKWAVYKDFNSSAIPSQTLGFTPDLTDPAVEKLVQDIREVTNKYSAPLMTGTVDPAVVLPDFIDDLERAGINELKAIFQQQLNEWKGAIQNA